ncbi:MAG: dienelactone hydrolase family protein [Pseudomonadota bacterium]
MSIATNTVSYHVDGMEFEGSIARDPAWQEPRPVVLVAHAWAGRSAFEDQRAVAIAELGYVGFAIDVYGRGKLGTSVEENSALMQPLLDDRAQLQTRLHAALDTACGLDFVDTAHAAMIGYCFGGLCALDLARTGAEVSGVVSLHGLFGAPDNHTDTAIKSRVLALHGWADPMAQPDTVLALADEMTRKGADWQLHAYGNALHAFTNPEANDRDFGTVYDADADRRSWQAVANFLAEGFGR